MNIKTRMRSFALALLMVFTTLAGSLITLTTLSYNAYAASGGSANVPGGEVLGGGSGDWGNNDYTDYPPMLQIYLIDSRIHDGEGKAYRDKVGDYLTAARLDSSILDNGVSVDGTLYGDRGKHSLFIFPTVSTASFRYIYSGVNSEGTPECFANNAGNPIESTNTRVKTSTWLDANPAWQTILGSITDIRFDSEMGITLETGDQLFKGYKAYRESINYNATTEFNNVISPYLTAVGYTSSAVRTLRRYVNSGGSLSLGFELYLPTKKGTNNYDYVSTRTLDNYIFTCGDEKIQIAAGTKDFILWEDNQRFQDLYNTLGHISKRGILFGLTYAYKAMKTGFAPVYSQTVKFDKKTDLMPLSKYIGGGWAYYSFCNNPGKTVELVIEKDFAFEGEEIPKSMQARIKNNAVSYFSFSTPISQGMVELAFVNGVSADITSSSAPNTAKELVEYFKSQIKTSAPTGENYIQMIYPMLRATKYSVSGSEGTKFYTKYSNNHKTGVYNSSSIPVEPKDKTYFFVYEGDCDVPSTLDNYTLREKVTQPSEYPMAVLEYDPVNKKWGIASFSDENQFEIVSSDEKRVTIKATNTIEVTKIEEVVPQSQGIVSEAIVLDTDNYYLTGYDEEFGFEDNKQLVYTNTEVVTTSKTQVASYSPDPDDETALNNTIDKIIEKAIDKPEAELNTPVDNTVYKHTGDYSLYINLISGAMLKKLPANAKQGIAGNGWFKVKPDLFRDYSGLDITGDFGSTDEITFTENFDELYSPLTEVEIPGWGDEGKLTISDFFETDVKEETVTHELSFYKDAPETGYLLEGTTTDRIRECLSEYSDYCKSYAVYEAAIAASATQIATALQYWSKAAQAVYAEMIDIKRDFETGVLKSVEDEMDEKSPIHTYGRDDDDDCEGYGCKYLNKDDDEVHDKQAKGYHPYVSATSLNETLQKLAEDCEEDMNKLAEKMKTITGWTTKWTAVYPKYSYSSPCGHYSGSGGDYYYENNYRSLECTGSGTQKGKMGGCSTASDRTYTQETPIGSVTIYVPSSDAGKFFFEFSCDSGITTSNVPKIVSTFFKPANNGSSRSSSSSSISNIKLGGILGKLCTTLSSQLGTLAELEAGRPHAEIKIGADYEAEFDNDVYITDSAKNTVPEYLISFYWQNQKPFLKDGTLLSSILDYEGRADTTNDKVPYGVTGQTNGSTDADALTPVMLLGYSTVPPSLKQTYKYDMLNTKTGGKTSVSITKPVYRWSYNDYTAMKAVYDAMTGDDKNTEIALEIFKNYIFGLKATNTDTELTPNLDYTKDGRYLVALVTPDISKTNTFTATELDAFTYILPKISAWTSIWRLADGNATNTIMPIEAWVNAWNTSPYDSTTQAYKSTLKITGTETAVTLADGTVTYKDLYKPETGNQSTTGTAYVEGQDVTIFSDNGHGYLEDTEMKGIAKVYSSQVLEDINTDYYLTRDSNVIEGKEATVTAKLQSPWYASAVPYKLSSRFSHYNVVWDKSPDTDYKNLVLDRTDDADGAEAVRGVYNRDNKYTVYPMVKTGLLTPNGEVDFAFVSGQAPRTFNERVYYKVGILGAAEPTVIANMIASDSKAQTLSASHGGAPVAYSGTGVTVSYDTSSMVIAMQTFAIVNKDAGEEYQNGWGNTVPDTTAHSEFLAMMGGTEIKDASSNVVGLAIPYVAGSDIAMKTTDTGVPVVKTHAWQLAAQNAAAAVETETYASTHSTVMISLIVEKAELVAIVIPDGAAVVGTETFLGIDENANNEVGSENLNGVATSGVFESPDGTTAGLLKKLKEMGGGYKQIAEALISLGINGRGSDDYLKKLFANNLGSKITADDFKNLGYDDKTAKARSDAFEADLKDTDNAWYNEYCNCLALAYECTTFKMQPVVLTDKIPIELGPTTPADRSHYFSNGYDFAAAAMLLKFIGSGDEDMQSLAHDYGLIGGDGASLTDVWYIARKNGAVEYNPILEGTEDMWGDKQNRNNIHSIKDIKPDIIIADVPATNANH